MSDALDELREELDSIDEQLIGFFCERQKVAKQIGFIKKQENLPIVDAEQKKIALEKRLKIADSIQMPRKDVEDLFNFLHDKSVEVQK